MPDLPRPPVVPPWGEHPPVIEPALRELPPFRGIAVGAAKSVEVDVVDERPLAEVAARARDAAFADARFRELVGDRRHTIIGVSHRAVKRSDERVPVLVAFCHDDGLTYEVSLVEQKGELRVRDISADDRQPAPNDDEIDAAIRLASSHRLVADRLKPEDDAHVLLVSAVENGDEHYGKRRLSVVFGPPDERLPRVHAVVDLGSEKLVWVTSRDEEPS